MEKEIRVPKSSKVMLYVLAGFFCTIAMAMLVGAGFIWTENKERSFAFFMLPMALIFFGLAAYFFQYLRKWHMIISNKSIREVGVFKANEIAIEDVKGYIADEKYLHIISASTGKKAISLSLQMGKDPELLDWIHNNFRNLDQEELQESEAAAMQDEILGATAEERMARLDSAKKVAKVLNIAGIAVGAWGFLFPEPYEWMCLACIAVPIISLIPYHYFKGAIKLADSRNSAYPNILAALMFPSIVIGLRAMLDFEILSYTNIWTYVLPVAITIMAVLFSNRRALIYEKATVAANLAVGIIAAMAFSYGSVIFINCSYDNNIPDRYVVAVEGKHMSSGKHTSYYLSLGAWGKYPAEDHSVDSGLYGSVEVGDEVNIYELKGRLGIPWLAITQ